MSADPFDSLHSELLTSISSIIEGETNYIANCANISSLIYHIYNKYNYNLNWSGFYFKDINKISSSTSHHHSHGGKSKYQLILGPFQGKIACIRIGYDRGVCGKCATLEKTIIVPDVDLFPGHIACDAGSKSEIVVPIFNKEKQFVGIIDIDSLVQNQFNEKDQETLEKVAKMLGDQCIWPIID